MPIKQISKDFTDIFGNVTKTYIANAGDKVTLNSTFESSIQMTSSQVNQLSINLIDNEISCYSQVGWLKEGFRLGDSVDIYQYTTNTGALLTSETGRTVTFVSETILRISGGTLAAFDSTINTLRVKNSRSHAELELNVNHIINSYTSSSNSLIDGEETKLIFQNLSTISVAGSSSGSIVGNKSGQFIVSAVITRLADVTYSKQFKLTLVFIQSGIYDKNWFALGECLKLNLDYKFRSLANDSSNLIEFSDTDTANTGWFNEAYNTDIINATLTSNDTSLIYGVSSYNTNTVVIDSSSTSIQVGACFISTDDTYYKNKVNSQIDITKLLDSYSALAVGTYHSNGSLYDIEITSITTVGTVKTIEFLFIPLTGFDAFIESFDEGDRTFYIWFKIGKVNLLVYSGQVIKSTSAELPLYLDPDLTTYVRHDENNETSLEITLTKSNIEDNLAFKCGVLVDAFKIYNYIKYSTIAYNAVTFEEFELENVTFNLNGAKINSSGQYILDEFQTVGNDLPSTSVKRIAHLSSDLILDQWKIYYPFINNWKYWEAQTNAPNDFYPNQNKNWLNYITGNWLIKTKITLNDGVTDFTKRVTLPISDYDTEPLIDTTIELYRADNTLVTAIFDGEIMTIKAVHTHSMVSAGGYWGEITIEETESSPRYLLSTEIDYDYNTNSPIIPITGLRIASTNVGNVTTFSCLLDASKCPNNAKITSKIFLYEPVVIGMQFENNEIVQFENGVFGEWE